MSVIATATSILLNLHVSRSCQATFSASPYGDRGSNSPLSRHFLEYGRAARGSGKGRCCGTFGLDGFMLSVRVSVSVSVRVRAIVIVRVSVAVRCR